MNDNLPKRKRQRLVAVSKNDAKDIKETSSCGVLALPTGVLSNCFSFLGPSGHYYFLASVCKDFKVAVDELYGDDRNTSVDSILTSVSTFTHVLNLAGNEVNAHLSKKVLDAVFENDRLDLFKGAIMKAYRIPCLQKYVTAMTNAIRYNSTEIMRFIIHENEEIVNLLKNKEPPEGIQIEEKYEDLKEISESIASAYDPQMIHQLVEEGVTFNALSISHSLGRKDLETFKCLVDILDHEDVQISLLVITQALIHEKHNVDSIKYLKQKGYFDKEKVLIISVASAIRVPVVGIDIVKCILEGWRDMSDGCLGSIVLLCINEECMDILSYIHESIQRINIGRWIHYAESRNLEQVAAHLRTMQ